MYGKIIFVLCAAAVFYFQIYGREGDLAQYRAWITESRAMRSNEIEPAKQLRKGVQKDIWTMQENQRLHYRLKSRESDLTIIQNEKKIEAEEQLHFLECAMQEDLEQVRFFTADEGTYTLPGHQFLAKEVDVFFFHLEELPEEMPPSPYLHGKAFDIAFSAAGKLPQLTAAYLQAEFEVP